MVTNPRGMKEILVGKSHCHFSPVSPVSLLGVSDGYTQRAVVDESGMTKTQMGMHSRPEDGHNARDVLYDATR
jgi:hypothetical protein